VAVTKKRVRGSRTGRPVMVLFDALGQRWTLRILWELRDGPVNFRALRERCDEVSPTVLNGRLKTLRDMDLVTLTEDGYAYTPWGKELSQQLSKLTVWAETWARR